ncbi:MAG: HAMP domain-containing sensor histidine kinase [Candidatus Eremiobacterota bacterium]
MGPDPSKSLRFSLAVMGVGLALWSLSGPLTTPPLATLALLGVVAVYGEVRSLYVPGYGALNLGECLYFGATLSWGPATGALVTALFGLAADRLNRKKAVVMVFNLGWSLTTFTLVGLVCQGADVTSLPRVFQGALVYALSAGALQAAAQSYFEGLPLRHTVRMQFQGMMLQAPAVLTLGTLCSNLLGLAPWAVLLMAFPVEIGSAYVRIRELHTGLSAAHRQLQEAQARMLAGERQASLGVMAAGVAHEINNPLAAMAATVHMLRRHPSDAALLGLLEKGIQRCQGITTRMLAYSRGPGSAQARSDLKAVLADALLFTEVELKDAGALPDLPPVRCEPGELVQVLTNLLSNARDASPELEVTARQDGAMVEVDVRDFGSGLPDEVRKRLFEPFFTTKPVGKGTGLGLFLARGIAERAGGSLELAATGPSGSTFRLRLPAVQA